MNKIIAFFYGLAVFHLIWLIASWCVDAPMLPSPTDVYGTIGLAFEKGLAHHLTVSAGRIGKGILVSLLVGLPIGLLMAGIPRINKILSPLLYLTYPIPKLALLPVVFLLAGIGETAKIIMIALIIVFQIIISVRDAGLNIPHEDYHVLSSLGAGFFKKLRWVTLPAILPELLTAIRISIGTAVSVLFFTETFGTDAGMGYFIQDSWMRLAYKDMYAGILVLSFLGLILFFLIDLLEKVLCRWKTEN